MKKRIIISMMIFGLSSVMSFANVLNDSTQNEETFIASTSEEDDAWIKIKDGKEEQAYRVFLAKYPNSQYAEQAASVVALYDAVRLYEQGKYEEASKEFSKAMVYNTLSKEMMEKYDTCIHAVKYKDVGNGAEYTSREYLQEFPNGMYATEASNNIARKMADGFDNWNSYSKSGLLGYSYNDALAYAKDFETYQYVKNRSNENAKNCYLWADEKTNSSLKWAQDKKTVSYVEDEYTSYLNRRFWDDRFALGWEYFSNDYSANTYGIGMGFTFRIGRYNYRRKWSSKGYHETLSPFNVIFGAKWMYNQVYHGWKKLDDYDFNQFGHHLIASAQLRWNIREIGESWHYGSWYFGGGGEYSYKFGGDLNLGGAYVVGQFGYAMRDWDIGVYYKHRVYEELSKYPLLNEYIEDDNYRIGLSMILYFMLNQ